MPQLSGPAGQGTVPTDAICQSFDTADSVPSRAEYESFLEKRGGARRQTKTTRTDLDTHTDSLKEKRKLIGPLAFLSNTVGPSSEKHVHSTHCPCARRPGDTTRFVRSSRAQAPAIRVPAPAPCLCLRAAVAAAVSRQAPETLWQAPRLAMDSVRLQCRLL
jgi:hypothetical protein